MNTLSKHIDYLLLSRECVIVPGIGGFLTHETPAFYDEEEHAFFPPRRTIGFNPQLTLNDGTLAHSYMKSYNVDYAKATSLMQADIKALRSELEESGQYHLDGIGTLLCKNGGHIELNAIESGALTPSLFALSRFEMKPLDGRNGDEKVITLKVSTVRRVASVAAATVAAVVLAIPFLNGGGKQQANDVQIASSPLQSLTMADTQQADENTSFNDVMAMFKSFAAKTEQAAQGLPKDYFTIVLACDVQPDNCKIYADMIEKEGGIEAKKMEVYDDHIFYGRYSTHEAAAETLRLMQANKYFKIGWVKEIHENEESTLPEL